MKYSILELQRYKKEPLQIDDTIDLNTEVQERFSDRLTKLSPVKVVGEIIYGANDRIRLNLTASGSASVMSAIQLEDKEVPFSVDIKEMYVMDEISLNMFELTDQVFLVENNEINIDEIVLENIIVNLPTVVEDDDADVPTSGDGWQLINEEDYQEVPEEDEDNPGTQLLGDFFPDDLNN